MRKTSNRRLRRNIQKFKAKKIDYSKYVKEFYLENGIAFISCTIKDYYDVINHYSVEEYEWLNEEFANYIESNAYYIPTAYPILIELCGKTFTEKEQNTIQTTISDYYSLKLGDKQLDLETNLSMITSTIIISILGLLLMTLSQMLGLDWAFLEISNIFFWIFVWRIADLVFERIALNEEKTEAAQLASIKVRFTQKFVDTDIDTETAEEIIEEIFEKTEEEE